MRRRIEDHLALADVLARLRCDTETGVSYWLEREVTDWRIKTWNKRFVGTIAGQPNTSGRVQIPITFEGVKFFVLAHRLIWAAHENEWLPPEVELDHKDRDFSNNAFSNLRPADRMRNAQNRSLGKNNTSGFKGVYPYFGQWLAAISADKKFIKLGTFDTPIEAAHAYDLASKKYHGEFGASNAALGLLQ